MRKLDTHDIDVMAGAIYFVVGRGTEGGPASYRLSIAGIPGGTADAGWGKAERVKADSGYSIGAIQVDLGQRGKWPLGSTKETAPKPGETTFVDAIIDESAKFGSGHDLKYTADRLRLRTALLTHGNGLDGRDTLKFPDRETFDTINAWASSDVGEQWIHRHIDYPQIKQATQAAMDVLDKFGQNVPETHRFEAIALLAKTENQMPAKMKSFEKILKKGGDYDDLLAEAGKLAERYGYYAGLKAVRLAGAYEVAHQEDAPAIDRAQAKVSDASFNPSSGETDPDIQLALKAIGQGRPVRVLRQGSHGEEVVSLQTDLARLGITDAHGHALKPDGDFGPSTRQAVVAFQQAHGLKADGRVGPKTLGILDDAIQLQAASLADRSHPGHPLFCQALEKVHLIDAKCGRTPDELSNNVAGALATAAQAQGLTRIDHVVLGENATRAFAVQGALDSPFRRFAGVYILQAVATPLAQSSADFLAAAPRAEESLAALPQQTLAPPALQDAHR
ncbi:XVIPCD domain-containing protein [Frateuria sp. GZRe14]|uniref:XVIPCD domain-containing protein n=1 Tax=Frateuria sp. GZRe14 TaxID=3351534 RepID=UPI003EDB9960